MERPLSGHLQDNLTWLRQALGDSPDLTVRSIEVVLDSVKTPGAVIFVNGLVNERTVEKAVIAPLQSSGSADVVTPEDVATRLIHAVDCTHDFKRKEFLTHILRGFTGILIDGHPMALVARTQGGDKRSPEEPQTEPSVAGPRDGLVESLDSNRSLIRRRLVDPAVRFVPVVVGKDTSTRVEVAYVEGKVQDGLVDEVLKRLEAIRTDGVLDAGQVAELIEDTPWSPFPQVQTTQRPDRVAATLLEGRVAILVDQSPSAILAPTVFWHFMTVPEDYYQRWWAATLVRMVRALAVFLSFTLPALWVILSIYHQELFPTPLALSIAAGRERIPLPAAVEALVLEFTFEVLREAGARLPRPWGQATSIVGGLVIGQAAVQAGLVSPSMVIIISMTGLASFATPAFSAAYAFRIIRFGMLMLSGLQGALGFGFGLVLVILHLLALKSFGVEYMSPMLPAIPRGNGDTVIRLPWAAQGKVGTQWWKR